MGKKILLILVIIPVFLSGCLKESEKFVKGDVQADFCGAYLNYQYCRCAFQNEFCEQVAMSKKEAEDYVNEKYESWVEKERLKFASNCRKNNGIYDDEKCSYCGEGKVVVDGKCVKEEQKEVVELEPGQCLSDTDCESFCEGQVMWNTSCNMETNMCEKNIDIDCKANMETFGEMRFPMICEQGECSRDKIAISEKINELNKVLSDSQEILQNDYQSIFENLLENSSTDCQNEDISDLQYSVEMKKLSEFWNMDNSLTLDKEIYDNMDDGEQLVYICKISTFLKSIEEEFSSKITTLLSEQEEASEQINILPKQ